jgi:hypothetical protein
MRPVFRSLPTALVFGAAFLLVQVAPSPFHLFGSEQAVAKDKGSKGSHGKSGSRGRKSSSRGGSKSKSNSKSSRSGGQNQTKSAKSSVASTKKTTVSVTKGKPQAVVREYALANGLKQGEVASLLKSWNSLNRNEQAYLNNLNNPNSLPGKQVAYIRQNMTADTALSEFETMGGDPLNPPTEDAAQAAQATIDLYNAWTAYQAATDPTVQADLLADFEALGGVQATPPTEPEATEAQAVIDQYGAWTSYQQAETAAEDALLAASVSYGANTDAETLADLRETVDVIITTKGLDTLVSEADATAETVEPETTAAP